MCFSKNDSLYQGWAMITNIATNDIIVYKYLSKKKSLFTDKYYAPVMSNFRYKKGKTYYSPLKINIHHNKGDKFIIRAEDGFHSFVTIENLIHYLALGKYIDLKKHIIGKFIIPKGTTYIENDEQIVSDRIKFIGVIPLKDLDVCKN